MWGNPKRERDSISFRKDLSAAAIQFPAKRDNLQHKTVPPQNCLETRATVHTAVRTC
jgi:hypothetical protein